MKSEGLLEAIGEVRDDYIIDAHVTVKKKIRPAIKVLVIAACLCALSATAIAAYANNWFGLRQALLTQSGTISLSGFVDSPEYQASDEWNEFYNNYVTRGSWMIQLQETSNTEEKYHLYAAYRQEMIDKIDEIAIKYGLALREECKDIDYQEMVNQVGGDFLSKIHGKDEVEYICDDGSFHIDGSAEIEGFGSLGYQLDRTVKGVFDTAILHIGDVNTYEEWPYLTPGGETVLLAMGPKKCLILGDFENCFITVNVLAGNEDLTKKQLETLAESIAFSVIKTIQRPDISEDDAYLYYDANVFEDTDWHTEDFERFGIVGLGSLEEKKQTWYHADAESMVVEWRGVTDFDRITRYGAALFEKTQGMGNYAASSFNGSMDGQYTSFQETCQHWRADNYYSDWYYEKGDRIYHVYYQGSISATYGYLTYLIIDCVDIWHAEDFEQIGLSGLEPLDEEHLTSYVCYGDGKMVIAWDFKTSEFNFHRVRKYGKALFEMTRSQNSGNYATTYDSQIRLILTDPLDTFKDACYDWSVESFHANWCYERNGSIYAVSYFGWSDTEYSAVMLQIQCQEPEDSDNMRYSAF